MALFASLPPRSSSAAMWPVLSAASWYTSTKALRATGYLLGKHQLRLPAPRHYGLDTSIYTWALLVGAASAVARPFLIIWRILVYGVIAQS